jgi:hypothetical protein
MIGRTAKTVLRASRQRVRPPREVCPFCLQADHISGAHHVPHLTVAFCELHHAQLTEERLAAGAEMKKQPNSTMSVEMALRSLAVTGHAIAAATDKLSESLEFCADRLRRGRI